MRLPNAEVLRENVGIYATKPFQRGELSKIILTDQSQGIAFLFEKSKRRVPPFEKGGLGGIFQSLPNKNTPC
jgi:hypothetical protein